MWSTYFPGSLKMNYCALLSVCLPEIGWWPRATSIAPPRFFISTRGRLIRSSDSSVLVQVVPLTHSLHVPAESDKSEQNYVYFVVNKILKRCVHNNHLTDLLTKDCRSLLWIEAHAFLSLPHKIFIFYTSVDRPSWLKLVQYDGNQCINYLFYH